MKEQLSIRIDPAIKKQMDRARRKMVVKQSQTEFIELAIYQRSQRIIKEGTV